MGDKKQPRMIGLYDIGMHLYAGAVALAGRWNPKARQWSEGRKDLLKRMAASVATNDRIVWVHVSSLGEFEQGRPLIEEIKRRYPHYKILVTFFSPSGYEIRKNYQGADFIFYLPLDTQHNARRFLEIFQPEISIFVKYEYWLNLLEELRRRKMRTFIVSSIFRRNSVFFKFYGWRWRRALKSFETLFVQNKESKELLRELGFENSIVAGDTRFDRVASIARAAKQIPLVERFKSQKRLFVAGSTWGPDEELLLESINQNPDIKFVIAPHEMEEARICHLIQSIKGGAVRYTQCSAESPVEEAQVLILDTVGLLSSLYGYADWAYIGGGFGAGIHNTLEAATFGLPIAFGPNYQKFKEARDMIELGAANSVSNKEEFSEWFTPLRDNEAERKRIASISRRYTEEHQGATKLILDTIFETKR